MSLPLTVTHATPLKRDVIYDRRAQQAALAIRLHCADGSALDSALILTPDQVELYHLQLAQAIEQRAIARREGAW
ncbi:hypothetical protein LRS74_18280 [Streptomyces sp. LX-29]|uniref:hypothetical protein n=1 Tax=Streptomyces sp. LX-29 TaxID=2900152 RepID=UPI00240CFED3|nr:hypothetical protein [Streptomyces sp. LX-29]WFB08771.1 hypothetical protein LRS74_18280 [Streptomyces sp. LX-29]